jgi:hypothetical protein
VRRLVGGPTTVVRRLAAVSAELGVVFRTPATRWVVEQDLTCHEWETIRRGVFSPPRHRAAGMGDPTDAPERGAP